MTRSKHYKWQQRWTVSLEAARATHESGLAVRFLGFPAEESELGDDSAIGTCRTPDGREWLIVAAAGNLQEVADALMVKHGAHNTPKMMERLAREAGEVWSWHKGLED